jgi:formylglycine-generating enzyme
MDRVPNPADVKTDVKYPPNMTLIPGGTFTMGCTSEQQDCGDDEKPTRQVTISAFWMAKTELTFEEYDAFCQATKREKPDDRGWGRGKRPVINVSWDAAVAYCNWRSLQEGLTPCYTIDGDRTTCNWQANGYRLPTEAEWEYAARGGGKAVLFGNGKNIIDPKEINFNASASGKRPYSVTGEYREQTVPVGSLNPPNTLGLHDMSGNVWEWCWDWYRTYPTTAQTDPQGPAFGSFRVLRGGSWSDYPRYARVAFRYDGRPDGRYYGTGFRLARAN